MAKYRAGTCLSSAYGNKKQYKTIEAARRDRPASDIFKETGKGRTLERVWKHPSKPR